MPSNSPLHEKRRLQKLVKFEKEVRKAGFEKVAGVDEAGRGPLAGPVVAACCMIEKGVFIEGVNDSKLLLPKKRETLFQTITSHPAIRYGIGIVGHETIDEINILQASILAMKEALSELPEKPDYILIDGNIALNFQETPIKKIIKGDQLSQSIAAASILAKVTRDNLMLTFHKLYPEYRFDKHKGYGTEEHLELLEKFGPSPIHRRSFSPVANL